jgi:predicted enzyme related to lactoylglutathione lyase
MPLLRQVGARTAAGEGVRHVEAARVPRSGDEHAAPSGIGDGAAVDPRPLQKKAVQEECTMAITSKGRFVWYEYLTRDVPSAVAFYTHVMGWKTQPFGDDYTMWVGGQGPLGGVFRQPEEAAGKVGPPFWMASVQADDVDATAAEAAKRGGTVWRQPSDIPTVGRFAVIGDPQGASFALFKPSQAMTLHDLAPDGEFCWNELLTRDGAAAVRFYSELLGWKILEEMDMGPMGKYRVFGAGQERLGGITTAPPGAPPRWIFYTSTGDLEAAVKRATGKGGKVINGPMDIPGGGRIAQLTDPQGAVFALHQAPAK